MVVESDVQMQDVFREGFKRAGYRVLMTTDPVRALAGSARNTWPDCVFFNAQQIGQPALEMFNELGDDEHTGSVPAVLLLDETQKAWKSQAKTAPHRLVLSMPLTMKQLRLALAQLTPTGVQAGTPR